MGPDSSNLDSPGVHRGEEHHQQQNNQQHNNITRYLYPIQQQNAQHNQHSVRAHSIHHHHHHQQQQQRQPLPTAATASTQNTTNTKQQTTLSSFTNSTPTVLQKHRYDDIEQSTEMWGDQMVPKEDSTYRICFENINGLGFHVSYNIKQDRFITWARENEIDAMGWAELNINWRLTTPSEKLRERMRQGAWDKLNVSTAHNIHEKLTKYQPGRVSLMTFDQLAHRVSSSGSDSSGLGRWTWQCIRCKTRNIRIISAYQPNITIGEEKQTVYAQQKRYLRYIQKSNLCPREAFRQDMTEQLQTWMEKGDLIVLMMDANDDLRDGTTHQWLTETIGLINSLHTKHPHLQPPSTYTRNFRNKPIDGCYISPGLHIKRGGFLPFRDGIGDHRILYIDVDIETWFEGDLYNIVPQQIRRLKCGDIRLVRKFLQELSSKIEHCDMAERVNWLYSTFNNPLTPSQQDKYEKIDKYITECCLVAEKRCRKIRAGNVPFSPLVDTAAKTIYLWSLILSKMRGTKVSSSLIKRLAKKCDIIIDNTLTYEQIRILRNTAIKRYKKLKPNAKQYREQFISDLADVMEEVYGERRASIIRSLAVTEEQRIIHRQVKSKLKPAGGSISRLQISHPHIPNEYVWTEDKDEIETNIVEANRKKFRLADNTPFRQDPLLEDCGTYADTHHSDDILLGRYDTTQLDMGTKIYIRHLKVPIPNKISIDEFQDYWRKVRERTSSSPSGRHFGQ